MKYYQEQEKEKKKLPFEKKLTLIIGVIIATIVVLGCVWYFAAYRKGIGRWVKTTEPTCTEYGYMTKVGLFGKDKSVRTRYGQQYLQALQLYGKHEKP